MPRYRRSATPGGTFFFTVVTYLRRPILTSELARRCLRESIHQCRVEFPFEIEAFVLLPDHLHTIWSLPTGDTDFSKRWGIIKAGFTKRYLSNGGLDETDDKAFSKGDRRKIWQSRFWEHTIRDEQDLEIHLDYIHINPVKHGYVDIPQNWEWTSLHRYLRNHYYERNWGNIATDSYFRFEEIQSSLGAFD